MNNNIFQDTALLGNTRIESAYMSQNITIELEEGFSTADIKQGITFAQ